MNTLRNICRLLFVTAALSVGLKLYAGSSDTNSVSAIIPVVNELSVTGAVTINVATPSAGTVAGGSGVTNSTAVLRVTTNQTNKKITVSLGGALPTGVALGVAIGSNSSGLSGTVASLSTSTADLATGISNLATNVADAAGINLVYTLTLTQAAASGTVSPVVSYTLTD